MTDEMGGTLLHTWKTPSQVVDQKAEDNDNSTPSQVTALQGGGRGEHDCSKCPANVMIPKCHMPCVQNQAPQADQRSEALTWCEDWLVKDVICPVALQAQRAWA